MNGTQTEARIYVACLASYNAGRLHGRWIDANQDVNAIQAEITEMLKASPVPGAEEFAIHDYEGFAGLRLSEFESVKTVAALAGLLDEHGEAFAAFYANDPSVDVSEIGDAFEETYAGEWDDMSNFAEELAEDMGVEIPTAWPFSCIDWEFAGRELVIGGDYWTAAAGGGRIHVYRSF